MTTVFAGVVVFTAVVLALVAVLLVAKAGLVGGGSVEIDINGEPERRIQATTGETLLSALASNGVLIPSACGGKGTCGVCKICVRRGGGPPLPTERVHISSGDARRGLRLACQLKLQSDLAIEVSEEFLSIQEWDCRVQSSRNVATFIKEIVLEPPEEVEALRFRAGSYVQVRVPPGTVEFADIAVDEAYRPFWEELRPLVSRVAPGEEIRRAYSMANWPGEREIRLVVRIATPPAGTAVPPGKASSYLFSLRPGDRVKASGPYGDFFVKNTEAEMVYIGGGAGMAPMRSHIFDLFRRLHTRRKVSFWYGARSLREAFYLEEFRGLAARHDNFRFCLALSEPRPEDVWDGATGFVHEVVYEQLLEQHPEPEEVEFYLCGPPAMLEACLEMLRGLGVDEENIRYDAF